MSKHNIQSAGLLGDQTQLGSGTIQDGVIGWDDGVESFYVRINHHREGHEFSYGNRVREIFSVPELEAVLGGLTGKSVRLPASLRGQLEIDQQSYIDETYPEMMGSRQLVIEDVARRAQQVLTIDPIGLDYLRSGLRCFG